jgi:hypothetical protein
MTTIPLALKPLERLVGTWTTEATHPALPGVVVHGTVKVEWLEGQRFLIHRARTDHPDFPDSISIIGFTERDRADPDAPPAPAPQLQMHYYDSRGVYREYAVTIDADTWRWSRPSPGFSQRFEGTFVDDGNRLLGLVQMSKDDAHWDDDLRITYTRGARP